METQPDFKELLKLFNDRGVEYLVVGAYALAFYGAPRYTGDIDLLIKISAENSEKIVTAVGDFGFNELGLKAGDFLQADQVIQLGVPPVRIDILTSLTGITWDEAHSGRESGHYGDVPVWFIGKNAYVKNKRATGRAKDLADIEAILGRQH